MVFVLFYRADDSVPDVDDLVGLIGDTALMRHHDNGHALVGVEAAEVVGGQLDLVALVIALPSQLRSATLFGKALAIPGLVIRMLKNVLHMDRKNTDFIHTQHG